MEEVKSSPNNSANVASRSFSCYPILSPSPTLPSLFLFVSVVLIATLHQSSPISPYLYILFSSTIHLFLLHTLFLCDSLSTPPALSTEQDRRENHDGLTFIVCDNLRTRRGQERHPSRNTSDSLVSL